MTSTSPPAVIRWPRPAEPPLLEQVTQNGLRILTAGFPTELVEVRLISPLWRGGELPSATVRAALTDCFGRRSVTLDADRTADELTEAGASLIVEVDPTRLQISLSTLPAGLPGALQLLARLVIEPAFDPQTVAAVSRGLAASTSEVADSTYLDAALQRIRHGDSPWGTVLTDADEALALTPEKLVQSVSSSIGPGGATLIMVGATDQEQALRTAESAMASWQGPIADAWPIPVSRPSGLLLIDRPTAVQSSIGIIAPAPRPDGADTPALALAVDLLGGGASSRLLQRLRERRGYCYIGGARIDHDAIASTVRFDTEVATAVTAAALNETNYEFARLVTTDAAPVEIEKGARRIAGSFVTTLHTASRYADHLARLACWPVSFTWAAELCRNLRSLTPEQLRNASVHTLAPTELRTVVIGDAAKLEDSLAALGPVQVVTPSQLV